MNVPAVKEVPVAKSIGRVGLVLGMMDDAYEGSAWHSLKRTLRGLTRAEMHYRPVAETLDVEQRGNPPYVATIARKVVHVALCKVMYENHAFGGRTLNWGGAWDTLGLTEAVKGPRKLVAALDRAHKRLRRTLASLADADLDKKVFTNWGAKVPAWWIFNTMIQHDLWHGAQISTLRTMYTLERARSRRRSGGASK